jgi:D-alanine-D-alanine ligase
MSKAKITVGVLFGGRSGEHAISIRSSRYVVASLDRARFDVVLIGIDRTGYWHLCSEAAFSSLTDDVREADAPVVVPVPRRGGCHLLDPAQPEHRLPIVDVVFPVLHGPFGEDGTIQGLLDTLDVPYAGPGVIGAAICMDKDVTKRLLRDGGVPIVPFTVVTADRWAAARDEVRAAAEALGYPLFVKPARLGSSLGVSRIPAAAALDGGIEAALALDTKVLIEQAIAGREIECAVLGNDQPEASVPGEIVPGEAFYSFDDKYAGASRARLLIPAPLDDAERERVRSLAVRAFRLLECTGMARVDFFLDTAARELYVNEVNTIPGFTSISMYPKLWAASGLPGPQLVARLIDLAYDRHARRRK